MHGVSELTGFRSWFLGLIASPRRGPAITKKVCNELGTPRRQRQHTVVHH
jgi:hypothetical protein